jgi:glyceraldehyde 3-phosphate dehydrogenase
MKTITVVFGVNSDKLSKDHKIVSNASWHNQLPLLPVAYAINQAVGIEHGYMTTIHSYTGGSIDRRYNAQRPAPCPRGCPEHDPDLDRRCESRRQSSAGTERQAGRRRHSRSDSERFLGRFQIRSKERNLGGRNQCSRQGCGGRPLKGILGYYDEPLVSSDFNHDKRSSIFSLEGTKVIDGKMVRVMSWYDNEWGFSNRMLDTAALMHKVGY